jgi:hypothetical protein
MLASDHLRRVPERITAPPRTYAVGPTDSAADGLALQRSIGNGVTGLAADALALQPSIGNGATPTVLMRPTRPSDRGWDAEVDRRFWERKGKKDKQLALSADEVIDLELWMRTREDVLRGCDEVGAFRRRWRRPPC